MIRKYDIHLVHDEDQGWFCLEVDGAPVAIFVSDTDGERKRSPADALYLLLTREQ